MRSLTLLVVLATGCASRPAMPDPALRAELLAMKDVDQLARTEMMRMEPSDPGFAAAAERLRAIDARHTARLKEIVATRGWPSRILAGADGASAAWLLVQHADADPAFQERCLPLLERAAGQGEVSRQDVALLTDRVLRAQGRRQRYGTQFLMVGGRLQREPTEDEAGLEERRRAVGLPPMAEYERILRQAYGRPAPDGGG
jgi:hypothetical protein